MYEREFEPGKGGWGNPQGRGKTPQSEEHPQAATPAAPDRKIDKAIDDHQDTGSRLQARPYAGRHLISRYSVSAVVAAFIAAELGMGGG
jgi:hypothetical protein